jgi:hypothetical protein
LRETRRDECEKLAARFHSFQCTAVRTNACRHRQRRASQCGRQVSSQRHAPSIRTACTRKHSCHAAPRQGRVQTQTAQPLLTHVRRSQGASFFDPPPTAYPLYHFICRFSPSAAVRRRKKIIKHSSTAANQLLLTYSQPTAHAQLPAPTPPLTKSRDPGHFGTKPAKYQLPAPTFGQNSAQFRPFFFRKTQILIFPLSTHRQLAQRAAGNSATQSGSDQTMNRRSLASSSCTYGCCLYLQLLSRMLVGKRSRLSTCT